MWYLVANWDTIPKDSTFAEYSQMKRGPNDKIYIGSWNGTYSAQPYLTFIDSPDNKGAACSLCKRCLDTKNFSANSLPNMFNYRLSTIICSDTIVPQPPVLPPPVAWVLYPNPANQTIKLKIPISKVGDNVEMVIYNTLGQILLKNNFTINTNYEVELPVNSYAIGVYYLKAVYGGNRFVGKFLRGY